MELIQKYIVTTPENNIILSSIPGTYKHLILQQIMKTDTSSSSVYHNMTINNDTTANYGRQQLYGYGSNASNLVNTRPTSADSALNSCGVDFQHYSVLETVFFDYAGSTHKNIMSKGGGVGVGGTAAANNASQNFYFAYKWGSTNAITSIKSYVGVGNYESGTTFLLWGLE
jgi:hypothetical protein